jgi:hypothetical protein
MSKDNYIPKKEYQKLRRKSCGSKRGYLNKEEATKAINNFMSFMFRTEGRKIGFMEPYKCHFCREWHFGHPPQKHRRKNMDLDLVEKWGMSGLLEGVKNSKAMAEVLEEAAIVLINKSGKVDQDMLAKSACLTFPLLRRVFGEKEFQFDRKAKSINRESVLVDLVNHDFVGSTGTYKGNEEEIELMVCEAASKELSNKISSYKDFVVSGIEVEISKDSFSVSVVL